MNTSYIHVWHVGARGGYTPFECPQIFQDGIFFTFFDNEQASPDAVQFGNNRSTDKQKFRFVPSILWEKTSKRDFYNTKCPFASGLKKLRPEYEHWYVYGNPNFDYILGDACRVESVSKITTTTVDNIVNEDGNAEFVPTVLVIDAQGCSFEILKGARNTLEDKIDFVIAETEFAPFFDEIPSFSLLLPLLIEFGFYFTHFVDEPNPWASPTRCSIAERSVPFIGSADAVFIRSPEIILKSKNPIRIGKYILCCLFFGFLEQACYVSRKAELKYSKEELIPIFTQCLNELKNELSIMPQIFGPRFGQNEFQISGDIEFMADSSTPLEVFLRRWSMERLAIEVKSRRELQFRELMKMARLKI